MSNKIHITINPYRDSELSMSAWDIVKEEPERVSVRFGNKEYQIVLDESAPFFEIWSVDKDGELLDCISTLRSPVSVTRT